MSDLNDPPQKFLAAVGVGVLAVPFILGIVLLTLMWRAWWLYPAWAWYVVPLGLPAISFWHFTALTFIVNLLTYQSDAKKDERETNWLTVSVKFFWPILGWALLWWMR